MAKFNNRRTFNRNNIQMRIIYEKVLFEDNEYEHPFSNIIKIRLTRILGIQLNVL